MATPKQTDPQFKLRMPKYLKDLIDRAAEENNRSINAEIVERLEASFSGRERRVEFENRRLGTRLQSIERSMERLMHIISSELKRQEFVRADPDRRSPEFYKEREGAQAFHASPGDPISNPYDEHSLEARHFEHGFVDAARRYYGSEKFVEIYPELRPNWTKASKQK